MNTALITALRTARHLPSSWGETWRVFVMDDPTGRYSERHDVAIGNADAEVAAAHALADDIAARG